MEWVLVCMMRWVGLWRVGVVLGLSVLFTVLIKLYISSLVFHVPWCKYCCYLTGVILPSYDLSSNTRYVEIRR